MKSPFDQNPEQEAEQQYERNLSRNYAPSERAEIRRSDQRASYNEAVLKQRAEIAGANAEIARSKLGVMEERLGLADIQSKIAQEKAELTQNDLKVKAARELKVISDANGFLRDAVGMDPSRPSFDTQYQKMLAGYPDAAESKSVKEWIDYHVPISKARRETEALIAKEARDNAALIATEQRKEKAEGKPKITITRTSDPDPKTGEPTKKTSVTGSPDKIEEYERTSNPPTGKAFLETLGIKTKPEKVKYVDGTPEG